MFDYRKEARLSNPHKSTSAPPSRIPTSSALQAASAQGRGRANVRALRAALQQSASRARLQVDSPSQSMSGCACHPATSRTTSLEQQEREMTPAELKLAEQQADERDWIAVDEEIQVYMDEGLVSDTDDEFCLLRYWQVRVLTFCSSCSTCAT
jgi:hypothetical protein